MIQFNTRNSTQGSNFMYVSQSLNLIQFSIPDNDWSHFPTFVTFLPVSQTCKICLVRVDTFILLHLVLPTLVTVQWGMCTIWWKVSCTHTWVAKNAWYCLHCLQCSTRSVHNSRKKPSYTLIRLAKHAFTILHTILSYTLT